MVWRIVEWTQEKKNRWIGNIWGPHTVAAEFVGLDDVSKEVLDSDVTRHGWSALVSSGSRRWTTTRRTAAKPTSEYLVRCEAEMLKAIRALPDDIKGLRVWSRPIDYSRPSIWIDTNSSGDLSERIVNLSATAIPPWDLVDRVASSRLEPASCRAERERKQWLSSGSLPDDNSQTHQVRWAVTAMLGVLALTTLAGWIGMWSAFDRFAARVISLDTPGQLWMWNSDRTYWLALTSIVLAALTSAAIVAVTTLVCVVKYFPPSKWGTAWVKANTNWKSLGKQNVPNARRITRFLATSMAISSVPVFAAFSWVLIRMFEMAGREFARNPGPALIAMVAIVTMTVVAWFLLRMATMVRQVVMKVLLGGGGLLLVGALARLPGWAYQRGLSLPFYSGTLPWHAQLGPVAGIVAVLTVYIGGWLFIRKMWGSGGLTVIAFMTGAIFLVAVLFLVGYTASLWQRGADFARTGQVEKKLSDTYPVRAIAKSFLMG